MSPCLVVAGGEVVSPNGVFRADVVVDHGVIATVARGGMTTPGGAVLVDATGLLVFPGLIDAHVHFQEPGREDWEGFATGSSAAAAGGVTTVVDMPIDCYPPTVTAAAVTAKAERARASSLVDVALWGGLIPSSVGELAAMAAAGVIGFKAFACPSGWDDFPPVDKQSLRAGMAEAARLGLPVALHCERGGHRVADEVGTVRWAGGIAAAVAGRLHAVHLSSAEAVDEARRWPGVTTETCPHYLLLDEGDVATAGATATCHPPIRDADNRAALWERALGGDVDIVASDHSPCPPSWRGRWAGIDGVGLGLPLLLSAGMPPARLAAMGTAAARLLRLVGKGSVAPGFDADLALVDPHASWTVEPATLWTRHRATPFLGRAVRGRVVRTLLRGRTIFELFERRDQRPAPAEQQVLLTIQPLRRVVGGWRQEVLGSAQQGRPSRPGDHDGTVEVTCFDPVSIRCRYQEAGKRSELRLLACHQVAGASSFRDGFESTGSSSSGPARVTICSSSSPRRKIERSAISAE